jgi:hypothetical protein
MYYVLLNLFTYLICLSPHQIGFIASIGRPGREDVPDTYLSSHDIRATKIGESAVVLDQLKLEVSGAYPILCKSERLIVLLILSDHPGRVGRPGPPTDPLSDTLPNTYDGITNLDTHHFSEVETNPEMSSLRSAYSILGI